MIMPRQNPPQQPQKHAGVFRNASRRRLIDAMMLRSADFVVEDLWRRVRANIARDHRANEKTRHIRIKEPAICRAPV